MGGNVYNQECLTKLLNVVLKNVEKLIHGYKYTNHGSFFPGIHN